MAFMTYLARHHHQQQQSIETSKHVNKRSHTLPTAIKKKREIGDYILCRTIGRGASGRVKLGIHKQTGEKVAIKMISRSHLTASSITSKSVQRELAVLQLLHHPHLIDLRQVLQDSSNVYFVMEYLEGGELFHVLAERGRLPENEARHLFGQLVTALDWCHTHYISHRDLKPENILLDKEKKNLKIADFGMAAMQQPNASLRTSCGSPHYASPEIVRGKRYDGTATDVWSCGAILYAMMTGHLPFDDEHMGRLLAKIKTGRYRTLPDYLSSDARDLIKRMLVVDPAKRMTMAEILNHPWLTNKSFLGTELRFLQHSTTASMYGPLNDPELQASLVQHKSDLDGKIWETLKVLWRDKSEDELIATLSAQGPNVQKLTCKLLQERFVRLESIENHSSVSLPLRRSSVIADDVLMTPPLRSLRHGSDDVESYTLPTPYESSIDTMSCCRTLDLPPTPKSTTMFQQLIDPSPSTVTIDKRGGGDHNGDPYSVISPIMQQQQQNRPIIAAAAANSSLISCSSVPRHHWLHDDGTLAQTEETRGSKSDAADVFIMTQPIESTIVQQDEPRSTWWLYSKDEPHHPNWWSKTCDYLFFKRKVPEKTIAIECFSKHECETAGKLHQVLEECFHGKLTGRMYPHGKIVWSGSMKNKPNSPCSFICHMTKIKATSTIRVHFIIHHGDSNKLESNIKDLLQCLNEYELESDWITRSNGWIHPEISLCK
ncbi:kinase-like domain-containing protein [Mucor lusitanicus]|uniref:Kinase-like domain-containing protein n=1 Tax=Mucor circinelloides f. lusitanicus TaxID=29924 RepID=A0A8H4F4N1_MUCCL|nr:kinase-like domain-containing protein [Mucor lusitanicus]